MRRPVPCMDLRRDLLFSSSLLHKMSSEQKFNAAIDGYQEVIRSLTSASNLLQRELCPGSAAAEEGITSEESEYSEEGTLLHKADAAEQDEAGNMVFFSLSLEQEEVLKAAKEADNDIFQAVIDKMLIHPDEPFTEGREEELWFRRGLSPLFPGHPDRWRYYTKRRILIVIDKKFGRIEVTPAEANRQLMAYALMKAETIIPSPIHIFPAINQPRLPKMQRITIGEYNPTSLKDAKNHILSIWDNAHNRDGTPRQDAPRIASEDACRYCKAKLKCDAYNSQIAFLPKAAELGKQEFIGKLLDLTDEQLDQVFVAIQFAGQIKDAAKAEIIRRKEMGGFDNYTIQPGSTLMKITDNVEAIRLLQDELHLPVSDIVRPVTQEKLVDLIHQSTGKTSKESKALLKETLASVAEFNTNDPTLKRGKPTQHSLT